MRPAGPVRGFILHPTYRVVQGRPEVHLYGTLETGASFCIIDDRAKPYFFVPTRHAAQVTGAVSVEPTDLRSFDGNLVSRVTIREPGEASHLRRRLAERGIACFEADLRFAYRYLIDRGIRGTLAIDGPSAPGDGIAHVFRNPRLSPASYIPLLRVLSIDIETDSRAHALFAIGIAGLGADRVLLMGPGPYRHAECFSSERDLLLRFFDLLRTLDPDVLTGWNVVDFDLAVLQRRCRQHGIPFTLGRTNEPASIQRDQSFTREARVQSPGRLVLDGLALIRGAFVRLEDYRLETAAQTVLGHGKLLTGDHRAQAIEEAFRSDRQALVDYNLRDAQLVIEILERQLLVDLAVSRSLLTGMQPDRVGAAIASMDALYLGALRRRGRVAPSVTSEHPRTAVHGGMVLEAQPGFFQNVLVFDFKSLYPSIIRTFNVDPLTMIAPGDTASGDVIQTPNGTRFLREAAILPDLVTQLWTERDAARRADDHLRAHAIKILMNSLFGVLAAPSCRFFSPALANAITQAGQRIIELAADEVERRGLRVLYGDTDSLFVDVGEVDPLLAGSCAIELRTALERSLATRLAKDYGVTSRLELEFEKCYRRFFLPEIRQGTGGSKKRYAGLVVDAAGERIEIVGLEAVRRDWTPLARRFQRALLHRVFHDLPVEEFVRTFVADLRLGMMDDLLVYRKAVRKPVANYTATTPPHVHAARRAGRTGGRIVTYVMTAAGPESADATTARLDYEHYVDRQLVPIAEALLRPLGIHVADLIGRARQLTLL